MSRFDHPEFKELENILSLSPPEVRERYADRLESLLLEMDPDRVYPYEFLYFRITAFRPEGDHRETYPGSEAMPDLLRLLEALAEIDPQDVDDVPDRVYSLPEVEELLNVSVRTIHRWRRRELVSRKYIFPDGRKRTGIRETALERYIERNRESVEWSRNFSKLTPDEEEELLQRVRELVAEKDLSLTAATNEAAEEADRSPETVRLLTKRYGRENPDDEVFGQSTPQLGPEARRRIYAQHRQGVPVEELQDRHDKSRSTIYRIINRERANESMRRDIRYLYDESFAGEDADEEILGSALRRAVDAAMETLGKQPADEVGPLEPEDEETLFRAYNYAKFRIAETQKLIDPKRYVPSWLIRHIESLEDKTRQIRECILYAHLPMVLQAARQHGGGEVSEQKLAEAGKECLREQVEAFDFRGRLRFARRLRLELMKTFARLQPAGTEQSGRS